MEKLETEKLILLKRTRKRTADTETDGRNGNTQAIVRVQLYVTSSVASCTDTYVFNLTLMAIL